MAQNYVERDVLKLHILYTVADYQDHVNVTSTFVSKRLDYTPSYIAATLKQYHVDGLLTRSNVGRPGASLPVYAYRVSDKGETEYANLWGRLYGGAK